MRKWEKRKWVGKSISSRSTTSNSYPLWRMDVSQSEGLVTMFQTRDERPYKCDQCSYSSADANNLAMHMKRHNTNKCDQCNYQGNQRWSLRRHIRSVHEGIIYSCDQCQYKATTKYYLKSHKESIHDGIKFGCDQCQYKASAKQSLRLHKRSIHDGI